MAPQATSWSHLELVQVGWVPAKGDDLLASQSATSEGVGASLSQDGPSKGCLETRPALDAESVLKEAQGLLVKPRERLKLREVHSPLSLFALRYKGLGLSELLRDLDLGKLGILPRLFQLAEKPLVIPIVNTRHRLSLKDKQCYYSVSE